MVGSAYRCAFEDPMSKELDGLLRRAANHVMTPKEIYEQRVSWIYGQLKDPTVTVENIRLNLAKMGVGDPADAPNLIDAFNGHVPMPLPDDVGPQRMVVCAAMRDTRGAVVCSPRHWDTLAHSAIKAMAGYSPPWQQGFVDQHGEFLTREQAWSVAYDAGQILRRVGGDEGKLFSENLY